MADNHSFDAVSEINHSEMHNAVVQAQHECAVRYDFKGTRASIEFNKKDATLKIEADHKGQLETVIEVLKEKMARRGVPVNALIRGTVEDATHDTVRETLTLHSGIDSDDARKIVKDIKQLKLKVQAQIMDDKVRVTGKKLDELQQVMSYLKENGPKYPLQFVNLT
ncbi:YajQ family cyclic di-GMP-binding protein [Paludisphaera borealis]|uniref:Nucleotide-binding protein BSF38_01091 n=1 Tax=Paludisphaera borealis TaxID=1387353 RepID=A0A1U7CL51_9BACT|nr:YajQ family cyclic di-GMP-binding protein [Paludisphaera borealis]APW59662.1 hypothetical protein BSF38_01091 [Paludisphaera borealis]